MNKIRQSFPWWQLILGLMVFAIILRLAMIYQDQLKENVLIPFLYLLWVGELALKSFDQQCIWVLTLFISLYLSVAYARRSAKKSLENSFHAPRSHAPEVGRIHFWRTQVRVSSSTVYAHSYRLSELRRLVIKSLAFRQNRSQEQIREQIHSEQLPLPKEVRYILGVDDSSLEGDQPMIFIRRIQQRFDLVKARFKKPSFSPDDRLRKVADYLENLLEVDNVAGDR